MQSIEIDQRLARATKQEQMNRVLKSRSERAKQLERVNHLLCFFFRGHNNDTSNSAQCPPATHGRPTFGAATSLWYLLAGMQHAMMHTLDATQEQETEKERLALVREMKRRRASRVHA